MRRGAWGVEPYLARFGFTVHRPPATLPSRSAIARPRLSARLPLGTLALFPPPRPGRFWFKLLRFQALLRFQIGFVWRFLGRRHVVREALPDAIALCRLACLVRTFVGQDSILVVRRVINDTSGIVSHDRTEDSLCHRLAFLPFIAATRLHLALLIPHLQFAPRHLGLALRYLAFVICHLPSVVRHPTSVIRLFCFSIPHPKIRNPQFPKLFQRSDQLAVPGGLVAAVPLECRAAIQRRAIVPLVGLVGLDFLMLGQQLLEPADVPLDDRADEDQRRVLIAGRRGDLAIGHNHETALIAHRQHISPVLPELVADAVAQRIRRHGRGN